MASSAPSDKTGQEQAGSKNYFERHYLEKLLEQGWSFSGFERDKLFMNRGDGTYLDLSGVSGADSVSDGRGVAFGDFDNDGDTDVFLHTIQGPRHLLFRNNVGASNGSLRIELVGVESNRNAYGATITVTAGAKKLTRLVAGGSGYLSVHDRRQLFGLGANAKADRIDIRWPSGKTQSLTDVAAGRSIRVTEGSDDYETVEETELAFADPPEVAADGPLVAVGDTLPELTLTDLAGDEVALASFRRHDYALVNFWATWCKPCQHEMPELQRLSKQFGKCLEVIGLSLDLDQGDKVAAFLEEKGITYDVALTDEASPLKVFREDNVLLPTTFLIDKDGKVNGVYVGGTEAVLKRLERDLEKICTR